MFRKILAFAVGILLITALAGCAAGETNQDYTSEEVYEELPEKFAGVVVAHSEQEIKSEPGKIVGKTAVAEGDAVKAGDTLFTYDMDSAALNLEKASLELEQLGNDLTAKQNNRDTLIKERDAMGGADQLSYTIEIQQCETEIRECQYNIALKQKEVDKLKAAMEVTEAVAPVAGRIKSIKENSSEGENTITVTVIEEGNYRVMGYVNENNAGMLSEGMSVTILSRNTDETWKGQISVIDWGNPASSSSSSEYMNVYSYATDSDSNSESQLTSSSKYPFYVELDSCEGLLLGQHVYIETSEVVE